MKPNYARKKAVVSVNVQLLYRDIELVNVWKTCTKFGVIDGFNIEALVSDNFNNYKLNMGVGN